MSAWDTSAPDPLGAGSRPSTPTAADALLARADGCGDGCAEALDRLFEYLDSELEEPDQERVRSHLEECKPCLEEFDVELVVKRLVRRCCQEEAPADLRVRVEQQMAALRTRPE